MNEALHKKILCTLGPASLNPRTITRLDELNIDLYRINLSHTSLAELEQWIDLIRNYSNIPICLDTQGAQVRTGIFEGEQIILESEMVVDLISSTKVGDIATVPLYPSTVLPQLAVGDLISIDFESALLQVIEAKPTCRARILNGGVIGSNKAVSVDRPLSLPPLTDFDIAAVEEGLRLKIKYFALSFANRPGDVDLLRSYVGDEVQIIAKIESRMGLENLTSILDAADAILIDRGDLSREVPLESLPFTQKEIIKQANTAKKPVYVATNLLESMVVSPRPSRAEVNDVINTLLDGADGLVLAAETAIGKHPVGCVNMVQSLIQKFEIQSSPPWVDDYSNSGSRLIKPHGGKLIDRVLKEYDYQDLQKLPTLNIDDRLYMDVKQIAVGTFSPLEGFMSRDELESVLSINRLPDNSIWPMPILFQLPMDFVSDYIVGETISLVYRNKIRALIDICEHFTYDLDSLAVRWFGTENRDHPGVARLLNGSKHFIAGRVSLLAEDLKRSQAYELTPAQARQTFETRQWQKVVGFHTRNVAHRAHEHLQLTTLSNYHCDGVFIHPVVGPKKKGDFS